MPSNVDMIPYHWCTELIILIYSLWMCAFSTPLGTMVHYIWAPSVSMRDWQYIRADSSLEPSQWETSLQSNNASHWLDANLKWALVHWYGWIIGIDGYLFYLMYMELLHIFVQKLCQIQICQILLNATKHTHLVGNPKTQRSLCIFRNQSNNNCKQLIKTRNSFSVCKLPGDITIYSPLLLTLWYAGRLTYVFRNIFSNIDTDPW